MNMAFLSRISERQQVAAVIVAGALMIGVLSYFLLLPQIRERQQLANRINTMRNELQKKNYLMGERVLEDEYADLSHYAGSLRQEWDETVSRLSTFREIDILDRPVTLSDYQTARIEVCDDIEGIARSRNIPVPQGLGLKATVSSFENVQTRARQLLAVEKLVTTLLDLRTDAINRITVMRPVTHPTPDTNTPFIEEYPIAIEFVATLDGFYDFCSQALADKQVFSLRNIRIEKASEDKPDRLRINAVMSALVFLGDVEQGLPRAQTADRPRRPMGY